VIRKIEARGTLDIAGRVKQRMSSVFRYAIQTARLPAWVKFVLQDGRSLILIKLKLSSIPGLAQKTLRFVF